MALECVLQIQNAFWNIPLQTLSEFTSWQLNIEYFRSYTKVYYGTNVQTGTNPSCCGGFTMMLCAWKNAFGAFYNFCASMPHRSHASSADAEPFATTCHAKHQEPFTPLTCASTHDKPKLNRDNQQISNITAPNLWNTLFMNPQRDLQKRLADISKTCVTSAAMLVSSFAGISELRPQLGQVQIRAEICSFKSS